MQATVEDTPESPTEPPTEQEAESDGKEIPNRIRVVICPPEKMAVLGLPILRSARTSRPPAFASSRDLLLPATARIGIPLYFQTLADPTWPMTPKGAQQYLHKKSQGLVVDTPTNRILYLFSTKTSPLFPHTGHAVVTVEPRPTILLHRADGKDLSLKHVKAIWSFFENEFHDRTPNIHTRLTPEKFVTFFESMPFHFECPVTLGCSKCGKKEGPLSKCGKCKVIKYCSAECQKGDWDYHKKVCVKG